MSESGSPDSAAVARELEALERSVGVLIEELDAMRQRVATAEDRSGKLAEALKASGVQPGQPANLEEKLGELAAENKRLRSVISEARERAGKIRSRLIVMEDEA